MRKLLIGLSVFVSVSVFAQPLDKIDGHYYNNNKKNICSIDVRYSNNVMAVTWLGNKSSMGCRHNGHVAILKDCDSKSCSGIVRFPVKDKLDRYTYSGDADYAERLTITIMVDALVYEIEATVPNEDGELLKIVSIYEKGM